MGMSIKVDPKDYTKMRAALARVRKLEACLCAAGLDDFVADADPEAVRDHVQGRAVHRETRPEGWCPHVEQHDDGTCVLCGEPGA